MSQERNFYIFERIMDAVSGTSFSVGVTTGLEATGLAVFVLGIVAVVFIRSKQVRHSRLVDVIRAWRKSKTRPPTE